MEDPGRRPGLRTARAGPEGRAGHPAHPGSATATPARQRAASSNCASDRHRQAGTRRGPAARSAVERGRGSAMPNQQTHSCRHRRRGGVRAQTRAPAAAVPQVQGKCAARAITARTLWLLASRSVRPLDPRSIDASPREAAIPTRGASHGPLRRPAILGETKDPARTLPIGRVGRVPVADLPSKNTERDMDPAGEAVETLWPGHEDRTSGAQGLGKQSGRKAPQATCRPGAIPPRSRMCLQTMVGILWTGNIWVISPLGSHRATMPACNTGKRSSGTSGALAATASTIPL